MVARTSAAEATPPQPALYGREAELACVRRLLDRLRAGRGGALLLTAPPGMGRTALLGDAVRAVRAVRRAVPSAGRGAVASAGRAEGAVRGAAATVLRARGVAAESGIAYAGVHALLCGVPEARSGERGVADGAEARAGGRGVVDGAELYELLRGLAAAAGPLLVCVDDVHLWDERSRAALGFAVRRLGAVPVAALLSAAEPHAADPAFQGVSRQRVGPLRAAAAAELLGARAPEAASHVRAEILAAAAGSPRLLTGLAAELTPAQLHGTAPLPDPLLAAGSLLAPYTRRLTLLPPPAREALLLAAAAEEFTPPGADLALLSAAYEPRAAGDPGKGERRAGAAEEFAPSGADHGPRSGAVREQRTPHSRPKRGAGAECGGAGGVALGGPRSDDGDLGGAAGPYGACGSGAGLVGALAEAEAAGVVRIEEGRVRFADPLLRTAAYAGQPLARRGDAHARLAVAARAVGEPPVVALLHRAAATPGPDPALGDALAAAAESLPPAVAADALTRAAGLGASPYERQLRLLAAAHEAWRAGRPGRAASLLTRAGPPTTPAAAAQATLLRGTLTLDDGVVADAHRLLRQAAALLPAPTDLPAEPGSPAPPASAPNPRPESPAPPRADSACPPPAPGRPASERNPPSASSAPPRADSARPPANPGLPASACSPAGPAPGRPVPVLGHPAAPVSGSRSVSSALPLADLDSPPPGPAHPAAGPRSSRPGLHDVYARAAEAAWACGDAPGYVDDCLRAARAVPGEVAGGDLLLAYHHGMARVVAGRGGDGTGLLRRVVAVGGQRSDPQSLLRAAVAAFAAGDSEAARGCAARAVAAAEAHGAGALVAPALRLLAYAELLAGRFRRAALRAADGLRAAEAAGQRNTAAHHHAILALAAATAGDAEAAARDARAASAVAGPHGLAFPATLATWALAVAELVQGRPAEAAARLRPLVLPGPYSGHFAVRHRALPSYAEAAALAGERDAAREALDAYLPWAERGIDPQAAARAARIRALLAPPAATRRCFEHVLAAHDRADSDHGSGNRGPGRNGTADHDRADGGYERARTQLLYGKALRRARRPAAARTQLRDALAAFERCGAYGWADQARAELRATGGGPADAGRQRPDALARLTPQQLRIARCVAEGATNREVAARLSVSHRTVDHHLRNIFAELGVRSRVELSRIVHRAEPGVATA